MAEESSEKSSEEEKLSKKLKDFVSAKLANAIKKIKTKEEGEKKGISSVFRIITPLFIFCQAFFPFVMGGTFFILIIILVVLIVVFIILTVLTKGVVLFSGPLLSIIMIIITMIIIQKIPSLLNIPSGYSIYKLLTIRLGYAASLIILLVFFAIGIIGSTKIKSVGGFIALNSFLIISLFVVLPFIARSMICLSMLSGDFEINELFQCTSRQVKKLVKISSTKVKKIPVSGGINVIFGSKNQPRPLTAPFPYEETFEIENKYEEPIKILSVKPFILTSFPKMKFLPPTNFSGFVLNSKESHVNKVEFNPNTLTVTSTSSSVCQYSYDQIKSNLIYTTLDDVECAFGTPCNDSSKACIKTGSYECMCLGWNESTCNDFGLRMGLEVTHTGFFRGNSSLLYYETYDGPQIYFEELTQGPISMKINFVPNPFIRTMESYINKIDLLVDFSFSGKSLKVSNITITPILTNVSTVDYQNNIMINQTIGMKQIWCNFDDLLSAINSGIKKYSGKVCEFLPPFVNITLINLKTRETLELPGITVGELKDYCYNLTSPDEIEKKREVYEAINESGICKIMDKTNIKKSFIETEVLIEINYEITEEKYSRYIDVIPSLCADVREI